MEILSRIDALQEKIDKPAFESYKEMFKSGNLDGLDLIYRRTHREFIESEYTSSELRTVAIGFTLVSGLSAEVLDTPFPLLLAAISCVGGLWKEFYRRDLYLRSRAIKSILEDKKDMSSE